MKIKRKNFAKSVIARYWIDWVREHNVLPPWDEWGQDWGEPCCFACGWWQADWDEPKTVAGRWTKAGLTKCHVVPLYLGGLDDPSNIVLMCDVCHASQPDSTDPQVTYDWMRNTKSFLRQIIESKMGEMMLTVNEDSSQLKPKPIAQRTKEGLAQRKREGVTLGRKQRQPVEIVERVARERSEGKSLRAIAAGLTADGIPTSQGGKAWHASSIAKVLARVAEDAKNPSAMIEGLKS